MPGPEPGAQRLLVDLPYFDHQRQAGEHVTFERTRIETFH